VAAGSRSNGLHAIRFGRSDLTAVYGRSDLSEGGPVHWILIGGLGWKRYAESNPDR
jgi:hypothetical protein